VIERGAGIANLLSELRKYLDDDCEHISLPPQAFVSPELYELEQDAIFHRAWMVVGRSDELARSGDYLALTVASEPVVVVRGDDGILRALSPICRHRLMPVVEDGMGRVERFTCPYHLWAYGLDGMLVGAPYMYGVDGFEPSSCHLPSLSVEEWQGLVFVNLDSDAEPVARLLAGVASEVGNYGLENFVRVAHYDAEWKANWKVLVENSSESYHHMGLHRETLDPLLPSRGTYGKPGGDWWSYHRTPLANRNPVRTLETLSDDDLAEAKLFRLFPTSALLTAGEFVLWADFIPLAVDRTRVRAGVLFPPSRIPEDGYEAYTEARQQGLDAIHEEDRAGVERIHRVAGSRHAGRGWLSPKEPAVMDFYRFLARALCC
jgi:phenylpropionate dioxygenase-like ring-hydroxylating dioxygenase large terminal subunit